MRTTRKSLNIGFKLPPDYTYTPAGDLMHKKAFERLKKLLKESEKRDPYRFGLRIFTDFFGYGILELIDETMSSIHTFVITKRWLEAWYALHALSEFRTMLDDWSRVDDGDRVIATERAFAGLLVKTLRELDSAGLLNERTLPELPSALQTMAEWANSMGETLDCNYAIVLNGYGSKLFGHFTAAEMKEKAAQIRKPFADFLRGLTEEEREERGDIYAPEDFEEHDKDERYREDNENGSEDSVGDGARSPSGDEDSRLWWGNANPHDVNIKDPSFSFTSTWKEYKKEIATDEPRIIKSICGSYYDLTTWNERDKRRYKIGGTRRKN